MKLYVDEEGSLAVRRLSPLVVSCVARVEVPAALWRMVRMDRVGASDAATLCAEFEADFYGSPDESARFAVVDLRPSVLDESARLVARHRLRAYDAMMLGSAAAAREADAGCNTFACFDSELREAALAEGFTLHPE